MSTTSVSIELTVNGTPWAGEVPAEMTLLRFIREVLALTGTKEGCGIGECSACVVILDGRPVNACLALAAEAHGATLRTIEGEAASGELTPLQDAFVEHHAVQCGDRTAHGLAVRSSEHGFAQSADPLFNRTPRRGPHSPNHNNLWGSSHAADPWGDYPGTFSFKYSCFNIV